MNFLAHIYLSGANDKMKVGNFIGDFVKGNQINDFEADIKRGIQLHRAIDLFTDTHHVVKESKRRLRPEFRHYSPVIVDVFYDHFLAKDWIMYSKVPLHSFTQNFYEMIDDFNTIVPLKAKHMLQFMKRDNWLYNYRQIEGISRALSGMSRRTKFESRMEYADKNLEQNYEAYQEEFHDFFPDLQRHCIELLKSS